MFSGAIPVYNHAAFLRHAVWSALQSPLVTEVQLLALIQLDLTGIRGFLVYAVPEGG